MEKNIKDYLHLYLGCEVMSHKNVLKLHTVSKEGYYASDGKIFSRGASANIKPILRPLSDMTEEEKKGLCAIGWCKMPILEILETHEAGIIFKYESFEQDRKGEQLFDELSPQQFFLLIKAGFDLFGLIESGLAIDKTKTI